MRDPWLLKRSSISGFIQRRSLEQSSHASTKTYRFTRRHRDAGRGQESATIPRLQYTKFRPQDGLFPNENRGFRPPTTGSQASVDERTTHGKRSVGHSPVRPLMVITAEPLSLVQFPNPQHQHNQHNLTSVRLRTGEHPWTQPSLARKST